MIAEIKRFLLSPKMAFVRYLFGCGCNFLIKTAVSLLLSFAGISFILSYFIGHCILLFCSFFYHHFVTFQRGKWNSATLFFSEFFHFTLAIIGLNVLDYLIVITEDWALAILFPPDSVSLGERQLFRFFAIALSSVFIFLLRFFVFRKIFRRKQKK